MNIQAFWLQVSRHSGDMVTFRLLMGRPSGSKYRDLGFEQLDIEHLTIWCQLVRHLAAHCGFEQATSGP